MTQLFTDNGELIPVTVIQAEPNVVLQKKTIENDGYEAIQLGFGDLKQSQQNKPGEGHAAKAGTNPKRYVREIRGANPADYEVGQEIGVDVFQAGDQIDVTGTSKGKGFQGNIKRHGHGRGPTTHGSHFHRSTGAIGMAADPARVFKGQKMPGQMGQNQVTIQNLEVVNVDTDKNVILVRGNVPGAKKSYVKITNAVKSN